MFPIIVIAAIFVRIFPVLRCPVDMVTVMMIFIRSIVVPPSSAPPEQPTVGIVVVPKTKLTEAAEEVQKYVPGQGD